MASCRGACQSGCRRPAKDGGAKEEEEETRERLGTVSIAVDDDSGHSSPSVDCARRCSKCGEGVAEASNGLCATCFRSYLYGKFKLAVTSNAMILPSDKILVAFSGGPASRVALEFIHEMQCISLKNWDASKSQALPVFVVGAAFIDESFVSPKQSKEIEKAIEEIRTVVSNLNPAHKEFHFAKIEDTCSLGQDDGKSRLNELLSLISDVTGKEDFVRYLRMLSLQKIALENGYSKVVLGSCTSALARHVISATVKGRGYSLPADVQYVDARWDVPVVLPLRDCLAEELSMLCHLDSLKMQQLLKKPPTGINGLISSFVAHLQEENPSRERTIIRTADKLKPFSFNKFLDSSYHDFLPSRLRCKFQNVGNGDSAVSEVFCPICGSPLSESEVHDLRSIQEKAQTEFEIFTVYCCQSCSFQVLPKGGDSLERFYSALPQPMIERLKASTLADCSSLREQIQDYLLDDDGT